MVLLRARENRRDGMRRGNRIGLRIGICGAIGYGKESGRAEI